MVAVLSDRFALIEAEYPTILDEPARRGFNMVLRWWWGAQDRDTWLEHNEQVFFGQRQDTGRARAMVVQHEREQAERRARREAGLDPLPGLVKIERTEGWKPRTWSDWNAETGGSGAHVDRK